MMGKGSLATTELDSDVVQPVGMQNLELFVRGHRARAAHADVLELDGKAEIFEGNLQKVTSIPRLIDHEKQTN